MIPFAVPLAAKTFGGSFLGAIRSVPRFVWYALAAALVYALAVNWYNGKIEAAEKRGAEAAYANVAKQARELEARANALNRSISTQIRNRTDEQNRAIARTADDLRVRGPGAARCASAPFVPAASGRHVEAGRTADDPGSAVPADDRAAVPWGWLTDRAEQADLNRAEALAWRDWHARFTAEWAKWKAEAEER